MTLSALGIFSAAGAGGAAQTYELIRSEILTGSQASVTFSNLGNFSSTYRHLQLRYTARKSGTGSGEITMAINGSGLSYIHLLIGTGSSVISPAISGNGPIGEALTNQFASNNYAAGVMDLLDVYSSTKNKTVRTLSGYADPVENRIILRSGLWNSTASMTSLALTSTGADFVAGSRFSLYGIRG